MRILLLGSTGILGTSLVVAAESAGVECVELGHQELEITDYRAVEKAVADSHPDAVINCVAVVGINPCEEDPVRAFNINAIAPSYIAKVCNGRDIVFVQPSTHAVFDGTKDGYYTEEDLVRPLNIYSGSKYMAELFAQGLCRKYYVVRLPTMFGPRRNQKFGFVDKVLKRIENREEIKIAADKIDSMTYSIDGAGRLIWMLKEQVPYGLYHLANHGGVSYCDFVKKMVEFLDADVRVVAAKDDDFPALGYKPKKTAMTSVKLQPMRSWDKALEDYVQRYLRRV